MSEKKFGFLGHFVLRMIVGLIVICVVNYCLAIRNIPISVGVNPVSALVSGFLGLPGVALLYGIVWV